MKNELLVSILARTDAIFLPYRFRDKVGSALRELRAEYPTRGFPWSSQAATEVDRKSAQRQLETGTDENLVELFAPRGTRRINTKLTKRGKILARFYAGLHLLEESLSQLAELARRELMPGCYDDGKQVWSSEEILTGTKWGGSTDDFVELQAPMMPLLVQQFVKSNCSVQGHAWYSLTSTGRAFMQGGTGWGHIWRAARRRRIWKPANTLFETHQSRKKLDSNL